MQDYINAASALVASLNVPAVAQSVWVRSDADPETNEPIYSVRAAIHPEWLKRVTVPKEINGKPVVQVDWQTLEPIANG